MRQCYSKPYTVIELLRLSSTAAFAYRSFIADRALDDVLVQFAVQVDDGLADAAVDYGHTAGLGAGDGCVGRR